MSEKAIANGTNASNQHSDASAALIADRNHVVAKQTPSASWLSTIVDYVPDKLNAPKFISDALPTLVKTAALFYPGVAGMAGYVAMSALDQAHPADGLGTQAEDLALGATKGALMVGAFRATSLLPSNVLGLAARGTSLGVASRFLDTGLDRNTYINPNTGALDFDGGLSNVVKTTFQPGALAIDAATFAVAGGLAKEATALTKGALATNLAATNALTGGIFGFSSGAFGEFRQEQVKKESFNPAAIIGHAIESSAIMAVAAIPGGLKMQHDVNVAANAQAEQDARSNNDSRNRIIPGPGRQSGDGSDKFDTQGAANDNSTAVSETADVKNITAKVTPAVDDASTNAKDSAVGPISQPIDTTPRIEFRMDKDGGLLLNPGEMTIKVNDKLVPRGETSIKPTDAVKVDIGDRYAVWKNISFGQVGTEPTVEGYAMAPGRSVLFDFNSLYYEPDAKGDTAGSLSLTLSRSNPEFSPGSYREPGSSITVDADGKMVLSPSYQNVFKLNGQLVKGTLPIQPGDTLQADIGDRYSDWKTLDWNTIDGQPALEGHQLLPGRALRFDPDVFTYSPKLTVDQQGRLVLTGPKISYYS